MTRKKANRTIPTYDEFLIPVLEALKLLDGSGSIREINEKVYELSKLKDEVLSLPHKEEGIQSEVDYRLAWARTYLKKYGLIENSSMGIWSLLDNNIDLSLLKAKDIVRKVRDENRKSLKGKGSMDDANITTEDEITKPDWREILLEIIRSMDPSAFERLCQRVLRESGFIQVEVTGKSGDGGLDGKGIIQINGFLSFHVFFQCKRFKDSVASSYIRDFRGAMQGRADKGLFITTGKFTRDAIKEASRDGASPIDLIDGDLLCDKLKELNLGVKTELIEEVTIEADWFEKFK